MDFLATVSILILAVGLVLVIIGSALWITMQKRLKKLPVNSQEKDVRLKKLAIRLVVIFIVLEVLVTVIVMVYEGVDAFLTLKRLSIL